MNQAPMTVPAWLRYDRIRALLEEQPEAKTFLEIGCGLGALGYRLSREYDYTGYELNTRSADQAARRIGSRGTVHPVELPTTPSREYDVVGAFEVLEHTEDDLAALELWIRWLRPGGQIILSVPAHPHRFGPADIKAGHYRRYTRRQLADLLLEVGLKDVIVWAYGFPLTNLGERIRNILAKDYDASTSMEERTAVSGSWLQFPDYLGWLPEIISLPIRYTQRVLAHTNLGVGFVARGRKP